MDDADLVARLRLCRTSSVGPVTYAQMIARFRSAAAALDALPSLARRSGGRVPLVPSPGEIGREMSRVDALGGQYLVLGRADYPALLAACESAPPALIVKGELGLLQRRGVAMVGARNASAAAIRFARELAYDLAGQDLVVISGLARGIDTAAHEGSISGGTIGVVAGGIDVVYPPENRALQEEIGRRGLIVSEQPPGIEPRARHFPSRNRIIAGLALGTVVVEAAPRSGSLITARLAAEAGRDVMAVPGSPLEPRAQGCNQLIRDGATLVQNAADVVEMLQPHGAPSVRAPSSPFAGNAPVDATERERHAIVALLGATPVPVDEVIRLSGCSPSIVHLVLLELELGDRLDRHAGARVSLR